jgi:hypothetical protein
MNEESKRLLILSRIKILYIVIGNLLVSIFIFHGCHKNDPEVGKKPPEYTTVDYTIDSIASIRSDIRFTDITQSSGIDFTHETGAFGLKWMPETMGSGTGFFDYDNDGKPDLFLVNSNFWHGHEKSQHLPIQKLYRNSGNGTFQDVTFQTGLNLNLYGMGCSFADYDSDGDSDIYLTALGDNKLLRNDGTKFTDVTTAYGVSGSSSNKAEPPAWSTGSTWLDFDHDGWLDLFVCNYVKWTPDTDIFTTLDGRTKSYATPQQYQGETCRLYRNLQGQGFRDITKKAGLFNPEGKSLGVSVADFNGDNWLDIVVANDTQPNYLYMNNQNGTFREIGLKAGVAYDEFGRARGSMGIDVADISNIGKLSIAIGNFSREPLALFTQMDQGLFQDLAGKMRLNKPSLLKLTFGLFFQDFDLDGYLDLFVVNGHIDPEINHVQKDVTYAQSPQLFLNKRNGQFIEITEYLSSEFREPIVGRGLASADIDNDGDLDLIITINGNSPKLLRNDLPQKQVNWIKLILKGEAPNLNAVGAKVIVWSGNMKQVRMVRTGSSYLSQSYIDELIFGLGQTPSADSLEVVWPTSGRIDKHGSLLAGKSYFLSENKATILSANK